jgi:hypothetical protein
VKLRQPKSHEYEIHPAVRSSVAGDRLGNSAYYQSRWKTFSEGTGMNTTKNSSSIQRSNGSQVEMFDLLILGGVPGQRSPPGPLLEREGASRSSIVNTSAARVQTSRACPARTSFTVPRSHRISAGVRSLASRTTASRLICQASGSANARWYVA